MRYNDTIYKTNNHIELNHHGTPSLVGHGISIIPMGEAHEGGVGEADLIAQYAISRAQLHATLAYYYEHIETVRNYQAMTDELLEQHGTDGNAKLDSLRKRA